MMQTRSRGEIFTIALVGVALIGVPDYLFGSEISLAVFYLGPVGIATWWGGREIGVSTAVISSLAALADDLAAGHFQIHPGILAWNAFLHLGFMLIVAQLLSSLRGHVESAEELARSDSLTGLFNRRAFLENLRLHLSLAARDGKPTTLAYIDIDDFKLINDRAGHEAGDRVLRRIATALQASTRRTDVVARLGGDEFALLIVGADQIVAVGVIAKLRHALGAVIDPSGKSVACSIGCVTFASPPPDAKDALRAADALMYQVKRRGKNAVAFEACCDRSPSEGVAGRASEFSR